MFLYLEACTRVQMYYTWYLSFDRQIDMQNNLKMYASICSKSESFKCIFLHKSIPLKDFLFSVKILIQS